MTTVRRCRDAACEMERRRLTGKDAIANPETRRKTFAGGTPALHTRHAASLRTAGLKKNEKFSGKKPHPSAHKRPREQEIRQLPRRWGG